MSSSPQVRYARTSDGVSIAYWVIGSGQPIIYLPPLPMTHIELEWEVDDIRATYERTARNNVYVRYDGRGFGLSDTDAPDFSLGAMVRDLEAVVDVLALRRFVIMSATVMSPVALAFASAHADQVAAMVLWEGARGIDVTFNNLATTDFGLYKQLLAGLMGFDSQSSTLAWQRLLDQAATQENTVAFLDASSRWDATSSVADVSAPTLVVHRRELRGGTPEATRRLAASLKNGTFATVEGSSAAFTDKASRDVIRLFLAEHLRVKRTTRAGGAWSGTKTVLFTDIVGHTEMMQRLGDERGRAVLREHERITRETLKAHGGAEVKTMGDGFMASFGSVTSALDCAIALQRAFASREGEPLHVRVGLNAGEPIEEDGDLFGATVILASRIAATAGPGEILVPDTVRGLLSGKGFVFGDRGEFVPKGFDEGVRVWDVRWRE